MKTFRGGVHPPDNKQWTAHKPIVRAPLPEEVVIHLSQHIGAPAEVCVAPGERVLRGQVVGTAKGFVSVPVHASLSGEVVAVEPRPHVSGRLLPAVVIRSDGEDKAVEFSAVPDPFQLSPEEIRKRIRDAGIVGLGGAAFPAHVKLSPPQDKPIDTLLLNGVECEPYLTADHRLMLEEPQRILDGARLLARLLGVERVCVGIEANKPDAIATLTRAASGQSWFEVVPLAVKYPQGAEKQLIRAILGREVPAGGLPMDVGVVVQNIGTVAAIWSAVAEGQPLVERVTTVTGPGVATPCNLRLRIGARLKDLVAACDGLTAAPGKIIAGGPMMGLAQLSLDAAVTRGTSGLLILREQDVSPRVEGSCIRCSRCVQVCPIFLLPTVLNAYARHDLVREAQDARASDCIECGSCSYACPAGIPLVQAIRGVKASIMMVQRRT